jgi:branched-chain amino acid transport system permease protein
LGDLAQILATAVVVGSLYALIALGYTMVYGILKFINFAHGDVVTLGAWVSFALATMFLPRVGVALGAPPWWAGLLVMAGAMAVCACVGFCIERFAYRPLRAAPRINVLITAIGVSLFLQNAGQLQYDLGGGVRLPFGAQPQGMPSLVPNRELASISLGVSAGGSTEHRLVIGRVDVAIVVIAGLLMIALELLVHRTKVGLAMRAVSFRPELAALMGVPVNRIISTTFVLGSALAAAAGFLYGMKYTTLQQTAHATWVLLGLKAFVAAVVGGIGNIRGAVVGALLIAFIEQFGARFISADMRDVYVFVVLILVLLVKPTGLFGSPAVEKV